MHSAVSAMEDLERAWACMQVLGAHWEQQKVHAYCLDYRWAPSSISPVMLPAASHIVPRDISDNRISNLQAPAAIYHY